MVTGALRAGALPRGGPAGRAQAEAAQPCPVRCPLPGCPALTWEEDQPLSTVSPGHAHSRPRHTHPTLSPPAPGRCVPRHPCRRMHRCLHATSAACSMVTRVHMRTYMHRAVSATRSGLTLTLLMYPPCSQVCETTRPSPSPTWLTTSSASKPMTASSSPRSTR